MGYVAGGRYRRRRWGAGPTVLVAALIAATFAPPTTNGQEIGATADSILSVTPSTSSSAGVPMVTPTGAPTAVSSGISCFTSASYGNTAYITASSPATCTAAASKLNAMFIACNAGEDGTASNVVTCTAPNAAQPDFLLLAAVSSNFFAETCTGLSQLNNVIGQSSRWPGLTPAVRCGINGIYDFADETTCLAQLSALRVL